MPALAHRKCRSKQRPRMGAVEFKSRRPDSSGEPMARRSCFQPEECIDTARYYGRLETTPASALYVPIHACLSRWLLRRGAPIRLCTRKQSSNAQERLRNITRGNQDSLYRGGSHTEGCEFSRPLVRPRMDDAR